ncbi:hypothetical protein BZA77DRAFT_291845 [Pyronema omphalodes]|nr:hypothetical protein BZA77DRAFT_291845 [Pyronema omphalodes]
MLDDIIADPRKMWQIRERLIESIRDGSSVFDMPDITPLAHWKHRLQKPEILRIADQFLAALKKIHTKGPDESVGGYVFKVRFDTICEVLRKCKGSVYRMSRSTTLDDIVADPRKIPLRQRFIDNQINNAKEKRDVGCAVGADVHDAGDDDEEERYEDEPQGRRKKRKAVTAQLMNNKHTPGVVFIKLESNVRNFCDYNIWPYIRIESNNANHYRLVTNCASSVL